MDPIGGYFGIELGAAGNPLHAQAKGYHSGRSALGALCTLLSPGHVYVPFYSCDSLRAPLDAADIETRYYSVSARLDAEFEVSLPSDGYLLYINYFGIKQAEIERLRSVHGEQLIVDNTHAFFRDADLLSFNSARKFFGVPDGAYAWGPGPLPVPEQRAHAAAEHLLLRDQDEGERERGLQAYRHAESQIEHGLLAMSPLSEQLLARIDYPAVRARRRSNFMALHGRLRAHNPLDPQLGDGVPYAYPWLAPEGLERSALLERGIFFPTLWPEVSQRETRDFEPEKRLADRLWPLPIDQRYDAADMDRVAATVENLLGRG